MATDNESQHTVLPEGLTEKGVVKPVKPEAGGLTGPPLHNPRIRVRVLQESIGAVGEPGRAPPGETLPIDVIAVGHYKGVVPVNAERALDLSISGNPPDSSDVGLIITQFTDREIITGDTAHPFFLPDPRRPERLIVIAGMGHPRKFSVPELAALVRQLCWSLGCLGRKHLATVLIGAGNGNLGIEDAVDAWLRGLSIALDEAAHTWRHLEALTFVEIHPARLAQIHHSLERYARQQRGVDIELQPLVESDRGGIELPPPSPPEFEPAYVTAEMRNTAFRFATLGCGATSPYQQSNVDRALILQANDKLIDAPTKAEQLEQGEMLHKLLFPAALWEQLPLRAPLVMNCDPRAARITWEMLAEPPGARYSPTSPQDRFLGLARGLTRRLHVELESAVSSREPRDTLKVLIVADPAKDRPLEAARREGEAVAKLFADFSHSEAAQHKGNLVQSELLLGAEATRLEVTKELQSGSYDVLHFAGHCRYDRHAPRASGLVFSNGEMLTAGEISQLRRVPSFVFANACYSGLMPDNPRQYSARLTPSLAAAFIRGGVGNLVCAAWQVNDQAGLRFAVTLYENLLGLDGSPQPMHAAMRRARRAASQEPKGLQTWGAYQHYGNPYFRFFRESH